MTAYGVTGAAVSPDGGTSLVSGDSGDSVSMVNPTLRLLDLRTGKPRGKPFTQRFTQIVQGANPMLALAAEGRTVAYNELDLSAKTPPVDHRQGHRHRQEADRPVSREASAAPTP